MTGLSFYKGTRSPSEFDETPDIDVTPVMNMFVILIPFLVSMAVFTQLSILEFSLPPNVGTGLDNSSGKPKLKLTAVVAPKFIAITQGEHMLDSLPVEKGNYNYDAFFTSLKKHREKADIKDEIVVAVRDAVLFKYVVRVMDRCRDAGFNKIGLSTATGQVESIK
ncbi:MAG: hypothetical protein GF401_11170 [Chitinivibrionales bacterium]|nr:hypothetical protein [Chitinivibrionales bacterium]